MARRKSKAASAPSTLAEATELCAEYAANVHFCDTLRAQVDQRISEMLLERDAILIPYEDRMKAIFTDLRTWWASNGQSIALRDRKTAEIAGCLLGTRTTPPSLKLPTGINADELITQFYTAGFTEVEDFIVHTTKLNKPAIIAALRTEGGVAGAELAAEYGLKTSQREEFFIDRVRIEPAATDPIIEEDEGTMS